MASREELLSGAQRQLNLDPTASMATIAEAVGVGRATLHRHFASREALLTEIGVRSLDRWESRLEDWHVAEVAGSGDADRIGACLAGLVEDFVTDADDFGFALTDSYMCTSPPLVDRAADLESREVELYAAAQAAGVLRADITPAWAGHAMYGLLIAARDALGEGDVPRKGLGELVLRTFLDGTGTR